MISAVILSCNKESINDNIELTGKWEEINDVLDKQILIFTEDTLFYSRPFSRYIGPPDTFFYRLDKKSETLYLRPAGFPGSSESLHKIQWNSTKNEITVWGLMISIPESPSVTTFKKQ